MENIKALLFKIVRQPRRRPSEKHTFTPGCRTVLPEEKLEYNDWTVTMRVSAQYVEYRLYEGIKPIS